MTFVEGDAEDLPFPDESFDVVLSTFGTMFAPDQERTASELLRVCRPGGTIGQANFPPDSLAAGFFRAAAQAGPAASRGQRSGPVGDRGAGAGSVRRRHRVPRAAPQEREAALPVRGGLARVLPPVLRTDRHGLRPDRREKQARFGRELMDLVIEANRVRRRHDRGADRLRRGGRGEAFVRIALEQRLEHRSEAVSARHDRRRQARLDRHRRHPRSARSAWARGEEARASGLRHDHVARSPHGVAPRVLVDAGRVAARRAQPEQEPPRVPGRDRVHRDGGRLAPIGSASGRA